MRFRVSGEGREQPEREDDETGDREPEESQATLAHAVSNPDESCRD